MHTFGWVDGITREGHGGFDSGDGKRKVKNTSVKHFRYASLCLWCVNLALRSGMKAKAQLKANLGLGLQPFPQQDERNQTRCSLKKVRAVVTRRHDFGNHKDDAN